MPFRGRILEMFSRLRLKNNTATALNLNDMQSITLFEVGKFPVNWERITFNIERGFQNSVLNTDMESFKLFMD